MKYFFLPMLLIVTLAVITKGQTPPFAPAGAEWYYGYSGGLLPFNGYKHYKVVGDTLYNGRLCKKLWYELVLDDFVNPGQTNITYGAEFFMQSGDSIFLAEPFNFRLLYRNAPTIGDEFQVQSQSGFNFNVKTIAVEPLVLNGADVKKITYRATDIDPNGWFTIEFVVYDRIGPQDGLISGECWGCTDYPYQWLRCFADNEMPLYRFSQETCDFTTVVQSPISGRKWKISPNPASEFARLDFLGHTPGGGARVSVFSTTGVLVWSADCAGNSTIDIPVAQLPAGIYLVQVHDDALATPHIVKLMAVK